MRFRTSLPLSTPRSPATAPLLIALALVATAAQARAQGAAEATQIKPAKGPVLAAPESRAAVLEANWTPLVMPNGDSLALLGASYMIAAKGGWGVGPAVYASAQGDYGGLFTAGFNVQRRWQLARSWHVAASLYAGAGGGVSSPEAHAGGGLMLRPELSLRREFGAVYAGLGVAHVRFPSGNIQDTQWTVVIGHTDRFLSFQPSDAGRWGQASDRTGMGFDEIALSGGVEQLRGHSRARSGAPMQGRVGKLGADLRHYWSPGSWWGIEASGAAGGGVDGYMEILANAGADVPVFSDRLRAGAQLSAGLGGGGDVDTGSGWLLRAGPTLRWVTPWGPSVRLDAGYMYAPGGHYETQQVRLSLSVPLEDSVRRRSGWMNTEGIVRQQVWYATTPYYREFRFKDGSRESVTGLGMSFTRDLDGPWYGAGQAGSAAWGKAGAFSYGLFGLGAQTRRVQGWRVGGEALVGAAGGGNVVVGGGGIAQGMLWGQWEGLDARDRLRVKLGVGRWQSLGPGSYGTPLVSLNIGWAYGTLGH